MGCMGERAEAFKYLLVGLKVDALIVGTACLLVLILSVVSFDGRCPDFLGGSTKVCSFSEYLKFNFGLTLILAVFLFWWIVLPALLIPPLLGLIIGYYKS